MTRFLAPPDIPVLDAPPSAPDEGATYYDSSLDALRVYAEGEWRDHASSGTPLFISDTAPTTDAPKYLWIETGLVDDGFSVWFEDGEAAPGGAGASPDEEVSLRAWYRSDDLSGTYADGETVTTWPDRSSNAYDLSSTSGSPTMVDGAFNGSPAVDINSSSEGFSVTTPDPGHGSWTAMFIGRVGHNGAAGVINLGERVVVVNDDSVHVYEAVTNRLSAISVHTLGQDVLLLVTYEHIEGRARIRLDGAEVANGLIGGNFSGGSLFFGRGNTGNLNLTNGELVEGAFWDDTFDDTRLIEFEEYANDFYNDAWGLA